MKSRKIFATVGVTAFTVGFVTIPPSTAASVGEGDMSGALSEVAVQYVQSDSPEEAQRILNQASLGIQTLPVVERYGPCTLIPRNVHVRTKTGDGDAEIVGFKPETKCSQPVESIEHESTLKYKYYTMWLDAPLKYGVPTRSGNRGVHKLEQRNVEFHCNGLVDTNFIGHTVGKVVANGKIYHAAVNTNVFRQRCKV